ncbi:hypothetical protein Tco_0150614 [Tanacetum coccineum]
MVGSQDDIPPPPPSSPSQTPTQQTPYTLSTIKLHILKKGEYDIWAMKMEHYLAHTDYPIWELYKMEMDLTTLLMALPEDHLAKFHKMTDAKEMWEFGGKYESKKKAISNILKLKKVEAQLVAHQQGLLQQKECMFSSPTHDQALQASGPNIEIDDSQFTYGPKQSQASESETQTSDFDTCDSNYSEDEHASLPTEEHETPSFANKQVKTPRETVKNQFTHSKNPKVDKKGMAKQAELNNRMRKKSSQREIRPIWNNVQRMNHRNQFVPKAVLTRTGKIPVNTARASGTNTVNTARHNVNRQAVPTNAANIVNTVKPIMNNARPKSDFHKSVSPFRKSLNRTTTLRTNFSYQKVNTAKVNAVSAVGGENRSLRDSAIELNLLSYFVLPIWLNKLQHHSSKANKAALRKEFAQKTKDLLLQAGVANLAVTNIEILKKFDFVIVKTASTPIETQKPLVKDEEASDMDVHLYRSMIGSLMYLTASRPDIMFAVCACSRFQVTPKTSHLSAVKRIFRYLKGKPKLGLWYPRVSSFDLEAYSDSDYAGANLDRKSTTGGCQFLGRRLISWQCKKQTIVATSTTEAEYVAAANCCGQVLWIQNQMLDYGFNFMNTKIYIDNESTICIVKNPVYHSKTKHIAIRHHFIRDAYEKKLIQVLKIHTDNNVANLLTKAFDVSRFQFLVVTIGMINP